jgi:phosphoribosyl-dephospho-CoA transferase
VIDSEIVEIGGVAQSIPQVKWGAEVDLTADDLLKKTDARKQSPERDEAIAFLQSELADGPVRASALYKQATEAGITQITLKRAARDLNVLKEKVTNANTGQAALASRL